jgi:signal transduction histidine kinase
MLFGRDSFWWTWLKWLITICVCVCLVFPRYLRATEHKQVLILHSAGREFRPWNEYAKQIREELDRQSPWPLDVREHSLETTRSADLNPELPFVEYLEVLYSAHAPDLIVSIGAPAAAFIQRHRDQFFPTTPAVFTAIEQRRLKSSGLTLNDVVVAVKLDFRFLFESFLKISPDTKTVAIVNGHSPNELFWRSEIQNELKPLEDRIDIRWYDNFSFQDILKQTADLPPRSAIFWNTMVVDATGVVYEGDRALKTLYATANAPIFTHDDAFFGREVVGGPMLSASVLGKEVGAVAARILGGEKPNGIKIEPTVFAAPKYDWRELQRWGINESRLPPRSEVDFRELTAWEAYKWRIVAALALLLFQGAAISGLLVERRRRLHFQIEAARRSAELAHFNRFSTAGELTASIAHEINQPLGAILINAETLQALLKSPAPDLGEIGEIVDDIHRDDKRAAEVILRLRNMLKKAPFKVTEADLNDIVRNTIQILSPLAATRKCNLESTIFSDPLSIKGDPIQIQQVLVNLIVNAADAMSDVARAERTVTISTARDDSFAEVSVSDAGPGISRDKLEEVFEPFFSTKSHGMGMGLSIARTIAEAHNGRLWAENKIGGGAAFRFRLPLSRRGHRP